MCAGQRGMNQTSLAWKKFIREVPFSTVSHKGGPRNLFPETSYCFLGPEGKRESFFKKRGLEPQGSHLEKVTAWLGSPLEHGGGFSDSACSGALVQEKSLNPLTRCGRPVITPGKNMGRYSLRQTLEGQVTPGRGGKRKQKGRSYPSRSPGGTLYLPHREGGGGERCSPGKRAGTERSPPSNQNKNGPRAYENFPLII